MEDKLKIKIKVNIVGPINWTRDINIDYNQPTPEEWKYSSRQHQLNYTFDMLKSTIDNIEDLLQFMNNVEFKIIE